MNIIDEVKDSCKKNFEERISSPFYGTFIISWLLWNWKILYVTFFIDSDLLLKTNNILKIDYISAVYKWGSFWDAFYSLSHILFFPLVSTVVIVYLMPKITCNFYEKSLETENKNKIAKAKKDEELLRAIGKKLDAEKEVLNKEKKVAVIKSEKSKEEKLEDEYKNFKNSKYFNSFDLIRKCIYYNNGWTDDLSFQIRAYFDSNDIIQNTKTNANQIELTEKGKYFMKKYTNELS